MASRPDIDVLYQALKRQGDRRQGVYSQVSVAAAVSAAQAKNLNLASNSLERLLVIWGRPEGGAVFVGAASRLCNGWAGKKIWRNSAYILDIPAIALYHVL